MKIRHPEKINKPVNLIKKKPSWIRSRVINSQNFFLTKSIINQKKFIQYVRKQIVLILQSVGAKDTQHF